MNKIELLAPCGTYEAFLAAIENGADAVYLGGKLFNARANASNFSLEELEKMVNFAHLRNVKVHITLNTLLNNNELDKALDFAYDVYNIGVDAVIVQDLGIASILHKYIPNLTLHASTQMTIHNLEGVNILKTLGFKRVVLARELSLEEIKYITENTDVEIEMFCHGALCVSYSGECLMSSMIGDRSGNRGKCAQPCRLPYTLLKNDEAVGNGYLLSPKDLSTLDILNKLPNITSLKIEGRMKSPEYVATTVNTYRKYLDELSNSNTYNVSEVDKQKLAQIFNRGGFTKAYLEEKQGSSMMCYERPKNWGIYIGNVLEYDGKRYIKVSNQERIKIGDGIEIVNKEKTFPSTIVSEIEKGKIGRINGEISIGDKVYKTYDKELMKSAKESYSRNLNRKTNIDLEVSIMQNECISFVINGIEYKTNVKPEIANKKPLSEEDVKKQLLKTGDTPFSIENLKIKLDENLFLPVSTLNELRRNALIFYENYLLSQKVSPIEKQKLTFPFKNKPKKVENVSLCITELNKDYSKLSNVTSIYVPLKEAIRQKEKFAELQFKKYILLPTITKANYAKLIKRNVSILSKICDGFVLSNIGQIEYFKDIKTELIANSTFNVFNDYTIESLKNLGIKKIVLSPELSKEQINHLSSEIPLEFSVYGNQVVMTSEYCVVGSVLGGFSESKKCAKPCLKSDTYFLKDRLGMNFRVIPDNIDCQSKIFNSKITSIESKDLNINSIKIDVIGESINDIQEIINIHLKGNKLSGESYTNGHINRPV